MTPMLELREVSRRFERKPDVIERFAGVLGAKVSSQTVHAVDRVSFEVRRGEVVGLVGESGCGKSTLGRMIAGLLPPSAGEIRFQGQSSTNLDAAARRQQRLRLQMIFQDPMSSLNPRMKVQEIIGEAALYHRLTTPAEMPAYVARLLDQVSLDPAYASRYPHQFSGGQRQRICIARALAVQPEFLVCDESVAALDVSIQAQVINLMMELQADLGLAYLFISHDIAVVERISHRVAVMYLGEIVEIGPRAAVLDTPRHPYTQRLIGAVPVPDPSQRRVRAGLMTEEIKSPTRPLGWTPPPTRLVQVGPEHFVREG